MRIPKWSVLILMAASTVVSAQTNTSTLRGTITDANQAVVPSVSITVTNVATGQVRTATSNDDGIYDFAFLAPGPYQLRASHAGFQNYQQDGITLSSGEVKRLDVALAVGSTSETITVTANVTAVQNESGSLSTSITPSQIESLPLLGRNFNTLIAIQPGVTANRATGGLSFNVNGGPAGNGFNITLDGTDATAISTQRVATARSQFQQTNTVSMEAVQEIRVHTNLYSAEIGRSSSGAVNVVTKSGSNQFHFGLFEYLRNSALNANSATANAARLERAPLRLNQFGANASGPLLRNKTFFWIGYEGVRQRRGRPATYTVLSDLGRSRIADATVRDFVETWVPRANQTPTAANPNLALLIRNENIRVREDLGTLRIDHQLSQSNSMFFRYNLLDALVDEPALYSPGSNTQNRSRQQIFTVSDTHTFSPSIVNEFQIGFNRFVTPSLLAGPQTTLSVSGAFGAGGGSDLFLNTAGHLTDSLFVQKGKHAVKLGFEFRRIKAGRVRLGSQNFVFNSVNDLFINRPQRLDVAIGFGGPSALGGNVSGFLQDDWKITPRLTLNLGLRYDYFQPPSEVTGRAWNITTPIFPISQLQFTGQGQALMNRDLNNFGPRFGFAYSPEPRTVIRGGYGVFFAPQQASAAVTMAGNGSFPVVAPNEVDFAYIQAPVSLTRTDVNLSFPTTQYGTRFPLLSPSFWDPNYKESYAQQWNLTIEREVLKDTVARAAYVGSKNTAVQASLRYNLPRPLQGNTREDPRFTNIVYFAPLSSGNYHAMQLSLNRRLSRGLAVDANYTWSHSIDNFAAFFGLNAGASPVQNNFDLNAERGESEFDIRHSFKTSFVYELPPTSPNRFVAVVTGGWVVSGIVTAQTGAPYSVLTGGSVGDGLNSQRANADSAMGLLTSTERALNAQILNRAAFAIPTQIDPATGYRLGNLSKSALVGPPNVSWDIGVHRNFKITEQANLQFRAEFFNAFNQVNYNQPVSTLNNPNFGRILGVSPPREIQFGLKLSY